MLQSPGRRSSPRYWWSRLKRRFNAGKRQRAELLRRTEALDARLTAMTGELADLRQHGWNLENVTDHLKRLQRVETVMDWIAGATLTTAPLVSVIVPTKDRRPFLERAIRSVEAQSYGNWELVVIDDASDDDTPEFLAELEGERIRSFRSDAVGASAARNVGLAEAKGTLITYLDDDNILHPDWLKAVVWAFEQRPSSNVLYGAFVVEDLDAVDPNGPKGAFPQLCFFPYDHHAVAENNVADMGCIAHRAGLPEATFDESLLLMGDWDLLLRLTREEAPIELPAIACYYTTGAPNRLSGGSTWQADLDKVREKNRR